MATMAGRRRLRGASGSLVAIQRQASPQVSGPLQGGTADHTKFEELKGPFLSGPEVTKACLGCHTETGKHFMRNIHWTWSYKDPDTGQQLGKRYLINNFCTNSRGNEGMCAQCHAGYGWKDETSTSATRPISTAWSATRPPAPTTRPRTPKAARPAP
jgi:hypothetical protein